MDVRQLRYFLAVAAERSFTRGARRLNMAQAPLSKRIQELEEELGVRLFDRESRPVTLTPAGHLLQQEASQVVRHLDQLRDTMRRFVAEERPRFVIGLVPSTLYARFPEVIGRFREEAPEFDIGLAEMDTPEQAAALKEGRIDAGFDRVVTDDPLLVHKVLREEPLVAALPRGHPLLTSGVPVGLAELAEMTLVTYPREPGPNYAHLVMAAFHDRGLAPPRTLEVRELPSALLMVASGAGACVVPESVRRLSRPDIGYAPIREAATVPLLVRRLAGTPSEGFRKLLRIYDEVTRGQDEARISASHPQAGSTPIK